VSVTVELVREKETKNTIRFAEDGEEDSRRVGMIYLPKSTVAGLGDPDRIALTVAVAA
jgi:hypothetical protein